MALFANLLAQLGIVSIGAGFGVVLLWPSPMGAATMIGAEALGVAMEVWSAVLERRIRPA